MNISWLCSCGNIFASGLEAFLHRDGTSSHHVVPRIEVGESGIDRAFAEGFPEVIDITSHLTRGARV
jgi:hypothetical protein